jgi:hypothetical protein
VQVAETFPCVTEWTLQKHYPFSYEGGASAPEMPLRPRFQPGKQSSSVGGTLPVLLWTSETLVTPREIVLQDVSLSAGFRSSR